MMQGARGGAQKSLESVVCRAICRVVARYNCSLFARTFFTFNFIASFLLQVCSKVSGSFSFFCVQIGRRSSGTRRATGNKGEGGGRQGKHEQEDEQRLAASSLSPCDSPLLFFRLLLPFSPPSAACAVSSSTSLAAHQL